MRKYQKVLFSLFFAGLAIFIMFSEWAKDNINSTTITLILIAFIPLIADYIKELEFFGVKVGLINEKTKQKLNDNIEKIKKDVRNESNDRQTIELTASWDVFWAEEDITKLVLARYQLEKQLNNLCIKYRINTPQNINSMNKSLFNNKIINNYYYETITMLSISLNKSIHSDLSKVNKEDINLIINTSVSVLSALEYAYKSNETSILMKPIITENEDQKLNI